MPVHWHKCATAVSFHFIIIITTIIIIIIITRFSCRRQGAYTDKLHVKAAKLLPLLDSPDRSKTQSIVGTVFSICTAKLYSMAA